MLLTQPVRMLLLGLKIPADAVLDYVCDYAYDYFQAKKGKCKRMSEMTQSVCAQLTEALEVSVLVVAADVHANQNAFNPFEWNNRSEESCVAELFLYVTTEFGNLQVIPQGFQLYDVHDIQSMLDTTDKLKCGWQLTGTSDYVIAPTGIDLYSLRRHVCVLFEVKSRREMTIGIGNHNPQAIAELFAARVFSNQPNVLVILTDFATATRQFTFTHDVLTGHLNVQYSDLSLDAMVDLVRTFLSNSAEPNVDFRINPLQYRAIDLGAIEFRRRIRAPGEMLERYSEMLDDADSDEDRAEVLTE